jgi:hypothetical protein
MATWRGIAGLIAAAYFVACAAAPRPPITPPTDLSQLAGEWVGEYSNSSTGREGILAFRLEAASDSAWGQAWMTSREWGDPDVALPRDLPASNLVPALSLRFARADRVFIRGQIEVYLDPEMEWPMVMTFTGRVRGDVMQGTYIKEDPNAGRWSAGIWKVERTRFNALKAEESASSAAYPDS